MRRFTKHLADEVVASWSNDGQFVYFSSNRSGDWQIWRMPATGGDAIRITQAGGYGAFAFSTGNEATLFYTKNDSAGLWSMPQTGGKERKILTDVAVGDWGNWNVTASGIYFLKRGRSSGLHFYSFQTKETTAIQDLPAMPFRNEVALSVSPDGQWLLLTQLDQTDSDLMLVERLL